MSEPRHLDLAVATPDRPRTEKDYLRHDYRAWLSKLESETGRPEPAPGGRDELVWKRAYATAREQHSADDLLCAIVGAATSPRFNGNSAPAILHPNAVNDLIAQGRVHAFKQAKGVKKEDSTRLCHDCKKTFYPAEIVQGRCDPCYEQWAAMQNAHHDQVLAESVRRYFAARQTDEERKAA